MITELGGYALLIAFITILYSFLSPIYGIYRNHDQRIIKSAENGIHATTLLLTITIAAILYAILTADYSIKYVYSYSNKELRSLYKISALWAGQEGSLLLWVWLLSLFSSISIHQNRNQNRELISYMIPIISVIIGFFLILITFVVPLFAKMDVIPDNGFGLNPLLRNPGMVYHPPSLYIGMVGFAIPFGFAMAALLMRSKNDAWIISTRKWTIFAWLFLTIGNILGSNWAYVELGWGGYWGWDPVENASFMPWLTGTAYLHSVMIQERKKMLKKWNVILVSLTFLLTILGTFITRSGIISSVHAFGESSVGGYFGFFLIMIILFSGYLIVSRFDLLKSEQKLDSLLSREASFLFNNIVMIGMLIAIFLGTMFPLISELFTDEKINLGPPFFNKALTPIGLLLLLLIGICPLIAWRKASIPGFKKNFIFPISVMLFVFILVLVISDYEFLASLSLAITGFVIATILSDIYRATVFKEKKSNRGYLKTIVDLISDNKRRYGGYIVHIGVVFLFIGFSGNGFNKSIERSLFPGDKVSIGNYDLTFIRIDYSKDKEANSENLVSTFLIEKESEKIGYMHPSLIIHFMNAMSGSKTSQYTSEVSIKSSLKEDLYLILSSINTDGSATFKFLINPLVKWIWLGGVIMSLGGIIILLPQAAIRRKKSSDSLKEKELHA